MVTSERARARARGARVACPHNVRDGVQHHISAPDAGSGQSLQQLSAFQHWPGVHDDSAETDTLLLRALQQQLNDRGPREGQNDVAIGDFGQSKLHDGLVCVLDPTLPNEGEGTRTPPSHAAIHEFVFGAQIRNTDPDESVDLFADEHFGRFLANVRRHVGNNLAHVLLMTALESTIDARARGALAHLDCVSHADRFRPALNQKADEGPETLVEVLRRERLLGRRDVVAHDSFEREEHRDATRVCATNRPICILQTKRDDARMDVVLRAGTAQGARRSRGAWHMHMRESARTVDRLMRRLSSLGSLNSGR